MNDNDGSVVFLDDKGDESDEIHLKDMNFVNSG